MLIDLLRSFFYGGSVDLISVIFQILAALFVIFCILPLHEFAHAWAAGKLGDHTAKYNGRLTMNPLASFDPIGSLFLLLFGFGWAKPVPIDPRYFKNPKRDMALTAVAGPLSNLLAAWVGALIYIGLQLALKTSLPSFVYIFFDVYITINVALAVFNLLPIPPLDGSKILGGFLSNRTLYNYYRYQNIIVMVAFLILFSGVLDRPIYALENLCQSGVYWLALLPYRLFGLIS
ncbi:MAG: Peptidase, M50 family [Clostridium sp.]|jgi:Zn-dependent protease